MVMIMRSMVRMRMRMIMRTVVMAAVVAPCTGGPPGRLPMELPPPEIRSNVVKEVHNAIMQLHIDIIVDTRLSLSMYECSGLVIEVT